MRKIGCGWRLGKRSCFKACLCILILGLAGIYFGYVLPFWGIPFNGSRHGRPPITPPWALECWLWEDDANTAAAVRELLAGYEQYDLPVRTILIDSPWSEQYNDFKVDENRYPEPSRFFRELQDRGYRVVLWMTCMVNSRNKDTCITNSLDFYEEARSRHFLAGNGYQWRWWKGQGGFIDYSNPQAMRWWHGLQKQVLDWGIDGWKLDGCDTFFSSRLGFLPVPFSQVHSGWMTTRQYMDHYARDEFAHGLARNPEFAILVRSVDHPWSHPEGFAPLDAAPVTWVGDNRHTWSARERGLEAAVADILHAARLGYSVIGSDVAGYHGRSNPEDLGPATSALLASWQPQSTNLEPKSLEADESDRYDEIAPNIYIRWAQFSAFCGLFLNGGHGERRLWKRSQAELEIIRKFSWIHTELVPYLYSHVVACHDGGPTLVRPMSQGRYQYWLGDDFLVAPIHEDKLARTVSVPPGRWRYLFGDDQVLEGPSLATQKFPIDEYPVFIREGAVVPLKVSRSYSGFGDRDSAGYRTWLIYPRGKSTFTLWHPESHPLQEKTVVRVASERNLSIEFSGKNEPHILRIHASKKPEAVTLNGESLAEGAVWQFSLREQKLVIRGSPTNTVRYHIAWP